MLLNTGKMDVSYLSLWCLGALISDWTAPPCEEFASFLLLLIKSLTTSGILVCTLVSRKSYLNDKMIISLNCAYRYRQGKSYCQVLLWFIYFLFILPISHHPDIFKPPGSTQNMQTSQSFNTHKRNSINDDMPPVPPPFPKDVLKKEGEKVVFL